jgi:hypothetical protein
VRTGTSVARDNRLATSVQTHFFDSGSVAAVGRQERWTQRLFAWLAKGGGRWKTSRANGCARRARKLCREAHWGGDLRAQEKVRERAGVAGVGRARRISRPVDCTGEHTGQGDGVMGALGCTQRTRGSRRVGSALEWQGGRRVSAHVQPARNFQGVSSAP